MNTRLPIPPPGRILREGCIEICDICGSSLKRRWFGLGAVIGCLQPKCWNWHGWANMPARLNRPIDLYGAPERPAAPPPPPQTKGAMTMGDEPLFEIGQHVKITSTPEVISGTVNAIYIDGNGAQFNVQYVDNNGRVQRDYFTADQLQAA